MSTTSAVDVTAGSGTHVATYSITEDAETKQLQRVTLSTSTGVEVDFSSASSVTQSGTWNVGLNAGNNVVGQVKPAGRNYETVAASQTDQAMGATGATGDVLDGLLIVPATTSPGAVSIKDGSGSAITIFTGGASSVSNLVPFFVPVGAVSGSGAWKVTTGANVSAIGVGSFT